MTSTTTANLDPTGTKNNPPSASAAAPPPSSPHPSTIDLRIGQILSAAPHPNATSLYLLQIQCDPSPSPPRTILTSLVSLLPITYFTTHPTCVVACNFKPVNMRGIQSQGMILTANPIGKEDEGPVEVVSPPEGGAPGERLVWEDGRDEWAGAGQVLNPKRKVWEKVRAVLGTDGEGRVVWRGGGKEGEELRLGVRVKKEGEEGEGEAEWRWCGVESIRNGMVS